MLSRGNHICKGCHKKQVRERRKYVPKGTSTLGKSPGKRGRKSSPLEEEAMQLIRDGISGHEVCRRLGIDRRKISKWRKDAGLSGENTNTKYSDEFKQFAVELSKKTTVAEAARQMNIPSQTLKRWRKKAGITVTSQNVTYSDELKQELLEMIRNGYTNEEVHKILGVPKNRITKWRKEAGISGGGSIYSEEAKNTVLDLLRERMSLKRISRETGIGEPTVRKWRDEFEKSGFLKLR